MRSLGYLQLPSPQGLRCSEVTVALLHNFIVEKKKSTRWQRAPSFGMKRSKYSER